MRRSDLSVYVQTLLLVVALTWVKREVPAIGQRLPFLLYFGAVLYAAWRGGRGPAAVAILASVAATNWFFLETRMAVLQSALFVAEGAIIAQVCELMRRSRTEAFEAASQLDTTMRSIGDAVIATDVDGKV